MFGDDAIISDPTIASWLAGKSELGSPKERVAQALADAERSALAAREEEHAGELARLRQELDAARACILQMDGKYGPSNALEVRIGISAQTWDELIPELERRVEQLKEGLEHGGGCSSTGYGPSSFCDVWTRGVAREQHGAEVITWLNGRCRECRGSGSITTQTETCRQCAGTGQKPERGTDV